MGFAEIAVALAWVIILAIGWAGYQLLAQYGRLLIRLEALEGQLADAAEHDAGQHAQAYHDDGAAELDGHDDAPDDSADAPDGQGVPFGTVLHDFELPHLAGGQLTFSQTHGQRRLLVFVNPACPHSRRLTPDLTALSTATSPAASLSRPSLIVVSTGPVEAQRPLFGETPPPYTVLLQEEMEVGVLFEVQATPLAYLVDVDGRTASPLVAGRHAILGLAASSAASAEDAVDSSALPPALLETLTTPAPINGARYLTGLEVGSPAPDIRLPQLDGGELALGRFRGRPVLIVFLDPESPPCDALLPQLEALPKDGDGPAIALISRRDPETNRAWATRHNLTLPLAMQPRWDVSRRYGMVAAPVGYLVDERGALADEPAVGADAILGLWASRSGAGANSGR